MIALDTNILVYAASAKNEIDRHIATLDLFDRLGMTGAIIALPVIGELFNVRRKKNFAKLDILLTEVEIWTAAFSCAPPQMEDYLHASRLSERFDLQYFDALIIAISTRAGATLLLSEDMQDGLAVDGLRIVNPFEARNEGLLANYFSSVV
jgi:predicted nucleic acid-binding protein